MTNPMGKIFELANGVLYGPVRSRRLGLSLGVNILPPDLKLCSFNCPYCQCGGSIRKVDPVASATLRFPSADEVAGAVRERLQKLRAAGVPLDSITFSGNGEPTLHPDFTAVVRAVRAVQEREWPAARLDILTNGAHLSHVGVAEGLNLLDERYVKLDAGSNAKLREMNRPLVDLDIEDVVRGLGLLRDFIVQAMFTTGFCDNAGRASVAEWVDLLGRIRPKAVHLYSLDRRPADPGVRAVDRSRLEEIAREVEGRAGAAARVF